MKYLETCGSQEFYLGVIMIDVKNSKLPGSCIGEKCWCGQQAHHKLEHVPFDYDEEILQENPDLRGYDRSMGHPLTSYICHDHFVLLMGPASKHVWG